MKLRSCERMLKHKIPMGRLYPIWIPTGEE
jgi:hypothetical protein